MGRRFNWIPCRRRRAEKEKAKEEARLEEERKAKGTRFEGQKNEVNPNSVTEPDAGTNAPEPAKLSAVK